MPLRVSEEAFRSDTGRQRTANEDSYYAQAPLFAVADGMGGAQAGEVASRIAADSFEPSVRGQEPPEAFLRGIAVAANERIHSLAQHDSSRSGMGTTLTAAIVEGDEVSFAHVGDSRAYLWRDGQLKLLTSDHSLVEELRRQGRISDEQAEDHPQRSIITRALGPESEVEVDTLSFSARPGDVFLLCSDGLTTMVKDDAIAAILTAGATLNEAVTKLVAAANEAGGRDNITVILFRLEGVDDRRAAADTSATVESEAAVTAEYDTFESEAAPRPGVSKPTASDETEAEYRRDGTIALQALPQAEQAAPPAEPPERTVPLPQPDKPRRRKRSGGMLLLTLAVILPLLIGAWLATRAVYFVGTEPGAGRPVAIYRGLPYELPFGLELYETYYESGVPLADVPPARRTSFTDHKLRSRDDAEDLVIRLEKGQVE